MKKYILSAALVSVFMVGCGSDDGLSDKIVKNYQDGINKSLDDFKKGITESGDGVEAAIKDFKCKKENKTYIVCESLSPVIKKGDMDVIKADKIVTKVNSIYRGDKKGLISYKEAIDSMDKQLEESLQIKGIELSDSFKGLVSLGIMNAQTDEERYLFGLANDKYDINIIGNTQNQDPVNLNAKFELKNITKNNELTTNINIDLKRAIFDIASELGIKYDTEFNNVDNESMQKATEKVLYSKEDNIGEKILKQFFFNSVNIKLSLSDIDILSSRIEEIKNNVKAMQESSDDSEKNIFDSILNIIDKFEKTKIITFNTQFKEKISLYELSKKFDGFNDEELKKNMSVFVNSEDIIPILEYIERSNLF